VTTVIALLRWLWRQRPRRAVVANVFLWVTLRHCAWYTLGDATIVISLYALGAWGHRSWGWGLRRVDGLWLPLAGILVAMVMERLALDFGRWQYGPDMPTLAERCAG
jgi:hypothetical protein